MHARDIVGQIGKLLAIFRKQVVPLRAQFVSPLSDTFLEILQHPIRKKELRVLGPAVIFLYELYFVRAERFAVRGTCVLLVWRSVADMAVHNNECWTAAGREELAETT